MRRTGRGTALGLAAALVLSACTGGDDVVFPDEADETASAIADDPGDCVVVDMAVSSEKIETLGIRDFRDHAHVMRDEQNRRAMIGLQFVDQ